MNPRLISVLVPAKIKVFDENGRSYCSVSCDYFNPVPMEHYFCKLFKKSLRIESRRLCRCAECLAAECITNEVGLQELAG